MAAGLGFKDFTTGEVLTAADVDGYLMQGVWVFASAAARDAAVTSPQEGNFAYLKDTNVTTYYTGSAWANLDTTGMTNPMTTTGDTIYSSSGSTPARLGIGSTGDVLTVAGGVPSWAAPAGAGGMTLLSTTTLSGASTTVSSINQTYNNLFIVIHSLTFSADGDSLVISPNGSTNLSWSTGTRTTNTTVVNNTAENITVMVSSFLNTGGNNAATLWLYNYASTTFYKNWQSNAIVKTAATPTYTGENRGGGLITNSAISSLEFKMSGTTFNGGTVLIYGVK
jgi:hypothetical protein